jgi:lipopolysaccharide biosynthesis protein
VAERTDARDSVHGRDPLVDALREENQRLAERNAELSARLEAMQAAQAVLAKHLRLTAPLRRVQEQVRLRASKRRRAARPTGPAVPVPSHEPLQITAAQAAGHPLLERTRRWASGEVLPAADLRPVAAGRAGRVAVVVHVYYPELWSELAERIHRIPVPVDLVVTLTQGRSEGLADRIVAEFPDVVFEVLPNRGRDMWPFVHVLELGLVGDHDAVLKLHTKASVHRVDGAAWRARLLDSLCPSPERITLMLELFRRDPALGMIAPAGGVLGREFWGSNALLVEALAARTGVGVDPDRTWFPGGSMCWAQPAPLLRLRDAGLTIEDFEHEAVSIDGTTAHALERFIGVLVRAAGQRVIGTDEVAGQLARLQH